MSEREGRKRTRRDGLQEQGEGRKEAEEVIRREKEQGEQGFTTELTEVKEVKKNKKNKTRGDKLKEKRARKEK